MDWWQKQDELEGKGYRITDRIRFPDGHYSMAYPQHWTAEMVVNEVYAYVANLETTCPHLQPPAAPREKGKAK